jgi:hypothetical protein
MEAIAFRFALFLVLSAGSISFLAKQGHSRWKSDIDTLVADLLKENPSLFIKRKRTHTWQDLPPNVQFYFRSVLHRDAFVTDDENNVTFPVYENIPSFHSVILKQQGEFNIDLKGKWLPFSATQYYGTENIGFIWDAAIATTNTRNNWLQRFTPVIRVCDSWVLGEGSIRANLNGIIPLSSPKDYAGHEEMLMAGERLRWLAEAFLVPTVLLPEAGAVQWKAVPEHPEKAILSMVDPFTDNLVELEVTFHPYVIDIAGERPAAEKDGSFRTRRWFGRLSDFQFYDGVWVPSHLECGWISDENEEEVQWYFRADTSNMLFERSLVGLFEEPSADLDSTVEE